MTRPIPTCSLRLPSGCKVALFPPPAFRGRVAAKPTEGFFPAQRLKNPSVTLRVPPPLQMQGRTGLKQPVGEDAEGGFGAGAVVTDDFGGGDRAELEARLEAEAAGLAGEETGGE